MKHRGQQGTIVLVVVFIATAIAALAAITSSRVVTESRMQRVLEDETRAFNEAFAQIHFAMNVVNNSPYDDDNHNLAIQRAMAGEHGGTASPDGDGNLDGWMADPDGVVHGLIEGTAVRVYRAREYLERLQSLRGEETVEADPFGDSAQFYVLEAAGGAGDVVRLVSALVRENQPFSSFVFFQNQHTLGISGEPRGLIHANTNLAFYFPNGKYVDSVTSSGGFEYRGGATPDNTTAFDVNPSAAKISIENVDFAKLKSESDLYQGQAGLDAEIKLFSDGKVRITPYTQPRWDLVKEEFSEYKIIGYEDVTYTVTEQVQVGTTTEERTREVISSYTTETYTVEVPIYETQEVERERSVPIYEQQTVTRTRWIQIFEPYDIDGGGTTVADDGDGVLGEYVWVEEEYQTTEMVIVEWETETYLSTEQVQIGTTTEERTREVPIYETETYTVEIALYEEQTSEVTVEEPIYQEISKTRQQWQYQPPVALGYEHVWVQDQAGMIYIDGRVTSLEGDLNGRLTIVSSDKVRITNDIRYVDDSGQTVMLNGDSITEPYERNPEYSGDSVLGVIAKSDVLFTWEMADRSEINATLMSVEGRVGIDGFWVDEDGSVVKDSEKSRREILKAEEKDIEDAYDASGNYRTRPFVKDSLRRIGGLISNERILETYIASRKDGTAFVDSGFKRGKMQYDFNMRFNPPPNFIELPRPELMNFAPVFIVRNNED